MSHDPTADKEKAPTPMRFGRYIQTYSSFLSSFVIGIAGLIATSTYQCSQAQVAKRQADAQQRIAETQADNSWKIERAKILSQNLQVLAVQGGGNVEQRYGVLLSLTRASLLDPELAVSYALELGKENPEYMRSVLSGIVDKDYRRLLSAFQVTCEQRFGLFRQVALCQPDKLADRSSALAELVSDEAEAAFAADRPGPLQLLRDEREAEANLLKLLWLFTPFLTEMHDRGQTAAISRFSAASAPARLIAALVLLATGNGDLLTSAEAAQAGAMESMHKATLLLALSAPGCDPECKGKLASILLSGLARSRGRYDEALQKLLSRPRAELYAVLSRLSTRILSCQVDVPDLFSLRDRVLVPLLFEQLKVHPPDPKRPIDPHLEDLAGLLALVPEPELVAQGAATKAAYDGVLAGLSRAGDSRYARVIAERRAVQRRVSRTPPPAMRKATFCNAEAGPEEPPQDDGG